MAAGMTLVFAPGECPLPISARHAARAATQQGQRGRPVGPRTNDTPATFFLLKPNG